MATYKGALYAKLDDLEDIEDPTPEECVEILAAYDMLAKMSYDDLMDAIARHEDAKKRTEDERLEFLKNELDAVDKCVNDIRAGKSGAMAELELATKKLATATYTWNSLSNARMYSADVELKHALKVYRDTTLCPRTR